MPNAKGLTLGVRGVPVLRNVGVAGCGDPPFFFPSLLFRQAMQAQIRWVLWKNVEERIRSKVESFASASREEQEESTTLIKFRLHEFTSIALKVTAPGQWSIHKINSGTETASTLLDSVCNSFENLKECIRDMECHDCECVHSIGRTVWFLQDGGVSCSQICKPVNQTGTFMLDNGISFHVDQCQSGYFLSKPRYFVDELTDMEEFRISSDALMSTDERVQLARRLEEISKNPMNQESLEGWYNSEFTRRTTSGRPAYEVSKELGKEMATRMTDLVNEQAEVVSSIMEAKKALYSFTKKLEAAEASARSLIRAHS